MNDNEYELCPHGRHVGAVCISCAEEAGFLARVDEMIYDKNPEYVDPFDIKPEPVEKQEVNGLNAPYYDLPEHIKCIQDLIEWLNLDFSNGNILKSLVRENNPNAKKITEELYEAEKRYYFASRHLQRVRNMQK